MKYTIAGEPILTEAMKHVILPMAVRDGLVHVNGDELHGQVHAAGGEPRSRARTSSR